MKIVKYKKSLKAPTTPDLDCRYSKTICLERHLSTQFLACRDKPERIVLPVCCQAGFSGVSDSTKEEDDDEGDCSIWIYIRIYALLRKDQPTHD
jgi:hypothetical protein